MAGGSNDWDRGDKNYDRRTDFDDLLALARRYTSSANEPAAVAVGAAFAADWTLARSLMPKPVNLVVVTTGLRLIGRRRRPVRTAD